ncbi:MAG: type II toxin-antitoxin system VapC family toxin [Chloroflexota bacterium]
MRVLLDTHAFLWWNADDDRLSAEARAIIRDGRTEVLVSVASIWEVATKVAKGRLDIPDEVGRYVADRLDRNRWLSLPIDVDHVARAAALPLIHLDPFDRMLVAQAQLEGIPILTKDALLTRYDVETIW